MRRTSMDRLRCSGRRTGTTSTRSRLCSPLAQGRASSNRYGVTPLHEAATIGSAAVVNALLRAGAPANAAYGEGETAAHAGRTIGQRRVRQTAPRGGRRCECRRDVPRPDGADAGGRRESCPGGQGAARRRRATEHADGRIHLPETDRRRGRDHSRSSAGRDHRVDACGEAGGARRGQRTHRRRRRPERGRAAVRLHRDADRDLQRPLRVCQDADRQGRQRQRRLAVHRRRDAEPREVHESTESARCRERREPSGCGSASARQTRGPECGLYQDRSPATGAGQHQRGARLDAALSRGARHRSRLSETARRCRARTHRSDSRTARRR